MNAGLPDIVADDLTVLFCGINPGMLAAASGHHFMGRGNRFWRVLHLAGFTPEQLSPEEGRRLLACGCGLTSVVERPTASAAEVSKQDFADAAVAFKQKLKILAPRHVAFLGKAAYAALSGQRHIPWGRQSTVMHASDVWVLPNPSGRNRAFTLDDLVNAYRPLGSMIQRNVLRFTNEEQADHHGH